MQSRGAFPERPNNILISEPVATKHFEIANGPRDYPVLTIYRGLRNIYSQIEY